jgi:hypothetical protein
MTLRTTTNTTTMTTPTRDMARFTSNPGCNFCLAATPSGVNADNNTAVINAVTAANIAIAAPRPERSGSKLSAREADRAQHLVVVGFQPAQAGKRLAEEQQRDACDHESEQAQRRRLYVETCAGRRTDLDWLAVTTWGSEACRTRSRPNAAMPRVPSRRRTAKTWPASG